MAVGILILSHNNIGLALADTAEHTLGGYPLPVKFLNTTKDCDPECIYDQAQQLIHLLDQGDGVLVLTDLYGSTPCNIATRLLQIGRVRVVTGLNLPMLIKVFNYHQLDLDALAEKAVHGGAKGVIKIDSSSP